MHLPRPIVAVLLSSAAVAMPVTALAAPASDTPPPVPSEYQATATELSADLARFRAGLPSKKPKGAKPPMLAAELLTANGNQGPRLLEPSTLDNTRLMLDALERIGAEGVTVDIPYPLLDPGYARNDEYLAFYRKVLHEVRERA